MRSALLLCVFAFAQDSSAGAEPLRIRDYRGVETIFPAGESSFVDRVVSTDPGRPAPVERVRVESSILGRPDFDGRDGSLALTLGCNGVVVVEFVDNALIEIDGPDLYIFEIGPQIEPTELAVSNDLNEWIEVGSIGGGRAEVDLANYGITDEAFRYVRLKDLGSACWGETPGADVDAVGAIGSAARIVLNASTLFDFDSDVLREEAKRELRAFVDDLSEDVRQVRIVGHTDAMGSQEYNDALGLERARSVAEFLAAEKPALEAISSIESGGETEPIEANDTDEGRQANRRVEIVVVP